MRTSARLQAGGSASETGDIIGGARWLAEGTSGAQYHAGATAPSLLPLGAIGRAA